MFKKYKKSIITIYLIYVSTLKTIKIYDLPILVFTYIIKMYKSYGYLFKSCKFNIKCKIKIYTNFLLYFLRTTKKLKKYGKTIYLFIIQICYCGIIFKIIY